jgi:hypothetical protein
VWGASSAYATLPYLVICHDRQRHTCIPLITLVSRSVDLIMLSSSFTGFAGCPSLELNDGEAHADELEDGLDQLCVCSGE